MLLLVIAVHCSPSREEQVETDPQRPNILFIMTDDHAYQAISAYGSELINTPNIDRLATEGMRFDRAFVTNSICSPSRAVALTGKFSHLNSVKDNLDVFDSTQQTFPKILQSNGYQTAIVGKWHLKSEPTGFDYWRVLPDQGHYYHPELRTPDGEIKAEGYVTEVVTDLALEFLDSVRDQEKPFLLMYHHKAPHRQWWPEMKDIEEFTQNTYPEPATLFDAYEGRGAAARDAEMRLLEHMGLTMDNKIKPDNLNGLGYEEFAGWYEPSYHERYRRLSSVEKANWDAIYDSINTVFMENIPQGEDLVRWKYQRYLQDYLGTIRSVDENIGRVLDYLDESGLSENTLVVYTSDQGFFLGEHGWFDKRFMYEESFRTPLIMRYPGVIKPGLIDNHLVQNIDFAPTFLELVGTKIPEDMQGRSLIPIITSNAVEWRDALYYHYYEYPGIHMVKRHYGIRTNRYKLIHFYYDIDEWELYDLENDPQEMNNLYGQPGIIDIQEQLHRRLYELQEEYQDSDSLAIAFIESDLKRLQDQ
jgi:arylsulfatase A-like enzyme